MEQRAWGKGQGVEKSFQLLVFSFEFEANHVYHEAG